MTNRVESVHESSILSQEQPIVSLVILTYNQLSYTKQCLESIQKHTTIPYELIVVDNASTDGTDEYLILFRRHLQELNKESNLNKHYCLGLKIIFNSENVGYAAGNNAGISVAEGNYIHLLNNDIVVTPGWLEKLLITAEKFELGVVGPVSNYVSGYQLIQPVEYDTQSLNGLDEFATNWSKNHEKEILYSWRVVGFCMLIKREVIEKIGGLDTRYGIGNFEDDDFCIRAAIAGFKSAIAKHCFVHHFGSQTFKSKGINYRRELLLKNWEIFKQKWGIPLHIPYGAEYDLSGVLQQPFNFKRHYCSPLWSRRQQIQNLGNSVPNPVAELLSRSQIACVDLGCGSRKPEGYIGVDIYPWPQVDIVADLSEKFPFPDNTVDEVRAHDFIEHLPDRINTMNEIWRICKPNGIVDILVPSTDGRGAFQDPTHVSYWNLNSFMYYAVEYPAYLELCQSYGFQGQFSIISLEHQKSPGEVIHVKAILKAIKPLLIDEASFVDDLNLGEINIVIFPDWNQPEEVLLSELENVVRLCVTDPEKDKITLIIDTSNLKEEDRIEPDLVCNTIGLNILLKENIEISENNAEICILEPLSNKDWQKLIERIHYRIPLPHENIEIVEKLGIEDKIVIFPRSQLK